MLPADPSKGRDVKAAELVTVEYADGVLRIEAAAPKNRLLGIHSGAVEVTVQLPSGSRVEAKAAAAELRGVGRLGDVAFEGAQGTVKLDETASAHLTLQAGDITVGRLGGPAQISTQQGDLTITEALRGALELSTRAGDITVGAARGVRASSTPAPPTAGSTTPSPPPKAPPPPSPSRPPPTPATSPPAPSEAARPPHRHRGRPENMSTTENYQAAERLLRRPARPGELVVGDRVRPQWIEGGTRFQYAVSNGVGSRFVLVDPAAGTREPAFDHTLLAAALAAASGQRVDPEALPFTAVEQAGNAVEFAAFGAYWRCRLDGYVCEPAEFTPPGSPLEVPSPDKTVAVSRRGHDLWARSLSDGREWALTTDGAPDHQYGPGPDSTANATLLRKIGLPYLPPAVAWSPDSTKVLAHRTDERHVRRTHLVEARPADGGAPLPHTQRYAYAGDEHLPLAELVVLDVAAGTVVRARAEPLPMPLLSPITAQWAWWAPDGSAVYYLARPATSAPSPCTGSTRSPAR